MPRGRARELRSDVGDRVARREMARQREGDRDGGVDVRAGEMPGRVDHGHDDEAEDGGHAGRAEHAIAGRVGDDRAAAGEDERERAEALGDGSAQQARRRHDAPNVSIDVYDFN